MQKKGLISIIFVFMLVITICFSAAAEDEWTAFQPSETASGSIACNVVGPLGPNEKVSKILPPISDTDWSTGPEDAPLTIFEYADFQCPYCSQAGIALIDFQRQFPNDVRYVYRHFPLSFHDKAPTAAYAADAAGAQGYFFEAEEFLYGTQNEWSVLESIEAFDSWLKEKFKTEIPDLDYDQWLKDYQSEEIHQKIDAAYDEVLSYVKDDGSQLITGTPSIFLNFNGYQGSLDTEALKKYLNLFKLQSRVFNSCPALTLDSSKDYRAVVDTSKGQITFDLFTDKAPLAVNNFVFLATNGWYDKNTFHRIVPNFVAQTGDPSATGLGTPGYYFADEVSDAKFGEPGMVGMANSGANKNGSQFFFTYNLHDYYEKSINDANANLKDEKKLTAEMVEAEVQQQLDDLSQKYSVFGKISSGYDIVESLEQGDQILSIKIEEKAK